MKLSIIVPVFNLEKYIGPCLDALVKVDFSPNEYEILVVDDGSTDTSAIIIEQYAAKYSQVTFIRQSNTGVGAARNHGLRKAKGDYLWLVDGDDLVVSEEVAPAIQEAIIHNVDALAFKFDAIDEEGNLDPWIKFELDFGEQKNLFGPEFYLLNHGKSYLWLYFFKRAVFVNGNLQFHPSIKMQDGELMPKIFMGCQKVRSYENSLIKYRFRPNSAVNNVDENQRAFFYKSMVTVAKSIKELQQNVDEKSLMYKALQLKLIQMNQMLFTNLVSNRYSKEVNIKFISMLKENGLLPFTPICGFTPKMNFKYNVIRKLVNINPHKGRTIYQAFIL